VAPEVVVENVQFSPGFRRKLRNLMKLKQKKLLDQHLRLAEKGERVIALAHRQRRRSKGIY